MGKLSPEQQKQLADLEAMRDADDDDDECVVWVRKGDHETRLTGDRARRWLRDNGYDPDDADDSTKAAPLEPKNAPAAKKATPKAGKAEADPEAGEAPDAEPPVKNRRSFF